jgi:hypothetical protein
MGRVLRIELRRSAAAGIGLLSLATGMVLLLSYPEGFAGRWMQLAVTGRSMLIVLWPLALAGGAWLGRREARSRVGELFASTARPRWQRVSPVAGALALTVVGAYTLMLLVGAAWVVPTSAYFPVTAVVVAAVGALSLAAAGWLGMAVGRFLPQLVTAPVLAVLAIAVTGFLPDWLSTTGYDGNGRPDPAAVLLTPVYIGGLDDFQTVVGRVNLTQALWLAALAATGLLLLGAARPRTAAVAVLPAALGVAIAVPLMPSGGYDAAGAVDPAAVDLVCDTDGARICVTRAHAGALPDVTGPAREALAMLAAKLPDAPTTAVESRQLPTWAVWGPEPVPPRQPADTLVFERATIGSTGRADFDGEPLLPLLLEAAWRQDCGDQREHRDAYLARRVAAAWVIGQPPTPASWWAPEDRQRAETAYRTLVGLPLAEQRRRLGVAREAALDCRSDGLLPILPADTP